MSRLESLGIKEIVPGPFSRFLFSLFSVRPLFSVLQRAAVGRRKVSKIFTVRQGKARQK
jgi:hypothetical protein